MIFFKRFIDYSHKVKISGWRKSAIGTWRKPSDPSIYGSIEVDVTSAMKYIEEKKVASGKRITLTHFVGKAIAHAFHKHQELNCMVRLGNIYQRKTVDVFFLVATDPDGKDLSGTTVYSADKKSIGEVAGELAGKVSEIRKNEDKSYRVMKGVVRLAPGILSSLILKVFEFVSYTLNIHIPFIGLKPGQFGSVMVTNVGSLGLDECYAPLVPYARTSVILAVSRVVDKPIVVENGGIQARPMVSLCCTADHRIIDGVHGAMLANAVREVFLNPKILDC